MLSFKDWLWKSFTETLWHLGKWLPACLNAPLVAEWLNSVTLFFSAHTFNCTKMHQLMQVSNRIIINNIAVKSMWQICYHKRLCECNYSINMQQKWQCIPFTLSLHSTSVLLLYAAWMEVLWHIHEMHNCSINQSINLSVTFYSGPNNQDIKIRESAENRKIAGTESFVLCQNKLTDTEMTLSGSAFQILEQEVWQPSWLNLDAIMCSCDTGVAMV